MDRQRIVIVSGGEKFNEKEIRKLLLDRLNEDIDLRVEIDIVEESRPLFPEILMESIEDIEKREEKLFRNISYQQQQKDLRFLNKRRKR